MNVLRPREGTVGAVRRTSRMREAVVERERARRESKGRASMLQEGGLGRQQSARRAQAEEQRGKVAHESRMT